MALLETLTDDFETGALDTVKWTTVNNGAGTATVSGGVLNCNTGGNNSAGVRSTSPYTFGRLSQISAKVVIDPAGGAYSSRLAVTNLSNGLDGGGSSYMWVTGGSLYFYAYDSASSPVQTSIAYNATAHAWLRMRFDILNTSVTTFFDTSPDGAVWTQRYTSVRTWTNSTCYARLITSGDGVTTPRTTTFDNVNMVAPKTVADIVDDFPGTSLDTTKWTPYTINGAVAVGGGNLQLSTTSTAAGSTARAQSTTDFYSLVGSAVYARVTPVNMSGANTYLEVLNGDGSGNGVASFRIAGTTVSLSVMNTGGTYPVNSNRTYDPTTWAYLRIRMDAANILYLDRSADGVTWTNEASTASPGWGRSTQIRLRIYNTQATAAIYTSLIDSVNALPAAPVNPNSLADPEAIATPGVILPVPVNPGAITDPETAGAPALAWTANPQPGSVADGETLGAPSVTYTGPPLETLTDTFDGPGLDTTKWSTNTALGGTVSVFGGVLRLNTSASNDTPKVFSGTYTLGPLSQIAAKVVRQASGAQVLYLFVRNPGGAGESYMAITGGVLYFYANANNLGNVTYSATTHAWLRMRFEISGTNVTTYYDTSPDGVTWTQQRAGTAKVWANASCQVEMRLGANASPPAVSTFDNINVTPAATPSPVSLTDPESFGAPALGWSANPQPGSLSDPETLGSPGMNVDPAASQPDSITDPETVGAPAVVFQPEELRPDGIAESEALADPDLPYTPTRTPDSVSDVETFGEPALPFVRSAGVDSLAEPEEIAEPYLTFNPTVAGPLLPLTDPETLGTPGLTLFPSKINPVGINETQALGAPSFSFISVYNGAYSTGDYGVGPYQGPNFAPAGLVDEETVGQPDIFDPTPVDPDNLLPLSIIDSETLAEPILPRLDATNWNYGASVYYGEGPATTATVPPGLTIYFGAGGGLPPGTVPTANVLYGSGTYGYGTYYGAATTPPPTSTLPPAIPLFPPIVGRVQAPLHVLGIGPWSPVIEWRGAPNYRVRGGAQPARPAMALPPATSKGFTLRLGDGGEARVDLNFTRGSAVVIDEMDTDLWWRRKDPRTKELEMIGRFNTAHVSVSTSDTGVSCSAQFVDYRTVLGERMVLTYKSPKDIPPTSQWKEGTPVMDVLTWALPDNTGLDLSAAKGPDAFDLGLLTQTYELPPGTLISDLMDNMEALSPHSWEWWIETPVDISLPPKLMFVIGERGKDKGVTLFDVGSGPTPIASWTRNAASDNYANSIYYSSGGTGTGKDAGGGVVDEIPAQILQYGQRDVQDGNSSMSGGDKDALHARAMKKLEKYADRRPNYTVRLKQGFWRGRSHIDIGDTVTVLLRLGKEVLHDKYRVAEIVVDIDDNGMEDVTLTLGRLPTSADPRSKRSPLIRLVRTLRNFIPQGNGFIDPDDD